MTEPLMMARRLTVLNSLGVLGRAAASLVRAVAPYRGDTEVKYVAGGQSVSGYSMMGLMVLELYQGREVMVIGKGVHARDAIEAITDQFNRGFDIAGDMLPVPAAHREWLDNDLLGEGDDGTWDVRQPGMMKSTQHRPEEGGSNGA